MKKIMFLFLACLISLFVIGCVSVDMSEKSDITYLPGMSKQQIFEKSKQWITYEFVSGRAVIDYKDLQQGRIIAKGIAPLGEFMYTVMTVRLISTIDCVNGKAKLTIKPENCNIQSVRGTDMNCRCTGKYLTQGALKQISLVVEQFKKDYKEYMLYGKAPAWNGK
jgi:hypothetical protein